MHVIKISETFLKNHTEGSFTDRSPCYMLAHLCGTQTEKSSERFFVGGERKFIMTDSVSVDKAKLDSSLLSGYSNSQNSFQLKKRTKFI